MWSFITAIVTFAIDVFGPTERTSIVFNTPQLILIFVTLALFVVLLLGGPNCYIKGMQDCWKSNIPKIWQERNYPLPEGVDPESLSPRAALIYSPTPTNTTSPSRSNRAALMVSNSEDEY